uniref:G-protein coupled receptors family 1 profile domain-containing protein n=1 Tax=Romanomermis culicivorax TaxID=13658 RepID=A0A915JMG4_ROMCU
MIFLYAAYSQHNSCSIFLSSFALTAIAIDRYRAVHYPHKRSRPRPANLSSNASCSLSRVVPSTATFVGLLSCGALLSAPLLFISRLRPYPTICGQFCLEVWPQRLSWLRPTYGFAVPALQFGLPLLITCYCYSSIISYLNLRHQRRAAVEKMLPSSQQKSAGRRRRVARMMIAMVGFFILCWFPMNFMNLARDYDFISSIIDTKNFNLYFAVSHLVAMTSVVWVYR